tara:strand:- start:2537 stop:3937 length:1401 start_codon:yes stop_codon:yes gene_type:complete
MINKIYKIINNKFSRFFKFVFFLRYLFLIFFVAITLFLTIPLFFDYKKKEQLIKDYLNQNYNLEIKKIESIKFHPFFLPHLKLENLSSNFYSKKKNFEVKKITIYPKLFSIYNYQNFDIKKIKIEDSNLKLNTEDAKLLAKRIFKLKKKIYFKNLDLKIMNNSNVVIELKNLDFINYGYKKNKIIGEVFNQRFKIDIEDDYRNINFSLPKTGVSFKINILEKNLSGNLIGSLKGKVLSSKVKLNFSYNIESIAISNLYFRDQKLSLESDGFLRLKPFFIINLNSKIKDIDLKFLRNFNLASLLKFQSLIKTMNSKNVITFNRNKFSNSLVSKLQLKIDLAHGRLNVLKNLKIENSNFICQKNINLLDEYPILYFNCTIYSPDIKKLLKIINIKYKNKKENFSLNFNGNINILSNKINFESIKTDNYIANEEDLKYFKTTFENILFDEKFIDIFDISKIRKFVLEIS